MTKRIGLLDNICHSRMSNFANKNSKTGGSFTTAHHKTVRHTVGIVRLILTVDKTPHETQLTSTVDITSPKTHLTSTVDVTPHETQLTSTVE